MLTVGEEVHVLEVLEGDVVTFSSFLFVGRRRRRREEDRKRERESVRERRKASGVFFSSSSSFSPREG